jgi:hypothetical protein
MDPHVYPDGVHPPQTAPLTLAPAAAFTFNDIEQLTGGADPGAPGYDKLLWIRVAMSGGACAGASPCASIALKADDGDPVTLTTIPTGIYRHPGTAPADYVADVQLRAIEAGPVFLLTIGWGGAGDPGAAWQLGLRNDDSASHDYTWVVSGTKDPTKQPWIDVTPLTPDPAHPGELFYEALIKQNLALSALVANKGTTAFSVTSLSPALPSQFPAPSLPLTVNPGEVKALPVAFNAPTTSGTITATADLVTAPVDAGAGTATGHRKQLTVEALTQLLEVVLLLDDSGSMTWDANGVPLPAGDANARWAELVDAVNNGFLPNLAHFGEGRGQFGIGRFPAGNAADPLTYDIQRPIDIPAAGGLGTVTGAVAGVVPTNGTPMGDGIDHVAVNAFTYFKTDPVSVASNRRWLIMLSDGAHNAGTHNPLEFVKPPDGTAPAGTSLAERNIRVFSVAYGVPGHTDVNPDLLQKLAGGNTADKFYAVDEAGHTAEGAAAAFRQPFKAGLTDTSSPSDPSGTFVIGSSPLRRHVLLTEHDGRVSFVLNWNTPDADRLRLELLTPNCELITPENAGREGPFQDVVFRGGRRSQMYLVDADFLRNTGDPNAPRFGSWTLVISSPPPPIIIKLEGGGGPDLESYTYDVLVESSLRMQLAVDRPVYFAGDPIQVTATLTADGAPITLAGVSLSTTAPDQSFNNFIAGLVVPPAALQEAARRLEGQDSSPLLVKTLGAEIAGLAFPGGRRQSAAAMTDPLGIGVYRGTITDTSTPERHTLYVTAVGETAAGVSFRREGRITTSVLVRPDAAHSLLDVRYGAAGQAAVTAFLRDQFGNVVLVDPAVTGGFGVVATGATPQGSLASNLDGSYSQVVTFPPGTTPAIGFQFGGAPVVAPQPVVSVGDLRYAERVVAFTAGIDPAANRHADPRAALGSIVGKPDSQFVSLGAGGQLTVAFHGALVVAHSRDLTVFVHPDSDLRSYRVEARTPGHPSWVLLGESPGVTRSFPLQGHGFVVAQAIRITDTSGRSRGADGKPLATPGVSISAVGIATRDDDDDDSDRRDDRRRGAS